MKEVILNKRSRKGRGEIILNQYKDWSLPKKVLRDLGLPTKTAHTLSQIVYWSTNHAKSYLTGMVSIRKMVKDDNKYRNTGRKCKMKKWVSRKWEEVKKLERMGYVKISKGEWKGRPINMYTLCGVIATIAERMYDRFLKQKGIMEKQIERLKKSEKSIDRYLVRFLRDCNDGIKQYEYVLDDI